MLSNEVFLRIVVEQVITLLLVKYRIDIKIELTKFAGLHAPPIGHYGWAASCSWTKIMQMGNTIAAILMIFGNTVLPRLHAVVKPWCPTGGQWPPASG